MRRADAGEEDRIQTLKFFVDTTNVLRSNSTCNRESKEE